MNHSVPSILDLIAADAGISPEFAKQIAIVGSDRWLEVRDQEAADHAADARIEAYGSDE